MLHAEKQDDDYYFEKKKQSQDNSTSSDIQTGCYNSQIKKKLKET